MADRRIHTRGLTSFFTLWGFLIMSITGLALYVTPAGRIAYWVNWDMFGLTKTEWGNIHILSSILFIVAGGVHTYLNWNPLMSYFKTKATAGVKLKRELIISSAVSVLVIVSALYPVPPLNYLLDLNTFIKDSWIADQSYEPPFGHAEMLSIGSFSKKMEINVDSAIAELERNGIQVSGKNETIEDIGIKNNISPMNVYLLIKKFEPAPEPVSVKAMTPEEVELLFAGSGLGNKSTEALCEKIGADLTVSIDRLKSAGIEATGESTLKKLGDEVSLSPIDLLKIMLIEGYRP